MNASFDPRNGSHPLHHVLARPRNDSRDRHPHRFHSLHCYTIPIHVDNEHDQKLRENEQKSKTIFEKK